MSYKKDIRTLSLDDLKLFCMERNLPAFRAKQVYKWLWGKRAVSFYEMSSLSKNIQNLFNNHFVLNTLKVHAIEKSSDKTIKYSIELHDKILIESVLIPTQKRLTACISSQAGCSLDCTFCATGMLKLKRNLTASEMYDQAFLLNQESLINFGKPISNIVFMGMGEPLLNYTELLRSINFITDKEGMGMSPKRITVSTVGIAKMIRKLADDNTRFNLAISLHAVNDQKRDLLMPINKKINLEELKNAIQYYYHKTNKRITYEYILFKNINDSIPEAKALTQFTKISPCKINIIEYNTISNTDYIRSNNSTTKHFIKYLKEKNIIVTLRKSKGQDINAACGQLINNLK